MERRVHAEISGVLIEIKAKPGDSVDADDPVLLVECMKMHIPIVSPVAGRIRSIEVAEGAMLEEGQLVFTIEA
jgi:biotin carboxyl carrier protein